MDVGQSDLDSLVIRDVNSRDSYCHNIKKLPLSLLMLRVFANYMDAAFAADHLAIFTNFLSAGSYFHIKDLSN